MPRRRKPKKTLAAFRPNVGIEAAYRRRIDDLVEEMHLSVSYWLLAAYRNNTPVMAMDDILPASALTKALKKLVARWYRNFDRASEDLAKYFAKSVANRSDKQLESILRRGGFSVKFKMTRAMRDIFNATRAQNVALIKSIPQQYLGDVEGLVMRSVQTGRDMGFLAKELQKTYGVSKRRSALIARTQNNLASASMNRARQSELGITTAIWMHSHAGKVPRPTHLKNDGKTYDVAKGWYDPDPRVKRFVQPGELINCRCFSKSVIPGFS
jgi:SPP1 gp7 family putative phage head morphogenesis protein